MGSIKLVLGNFKRSFRNYFSMILSLGFTIMILYNFINLTYTETFKELGEQNKEYIDIIIQVVSFVLICFLFFFIWYATNVFLAKRKKEIGVYVFMGLTNRRIAGIYAFETALIGVAALLAGIACGIVSTWLFQIILLKISDISIDISFAFSYKPILLTALIYMIVYLIFVVKGYMNIVKSSVLEMLSSNRQNEYVRTSGYILIMKAVFGVTVLLNGYYLATKESGYNVMGNLLSATVFVIAGTYLIFGGFLPLLFQKLADNKGFLYGKGRTFWINNVIFRMKKNYRTYAMTCVLLTCSVTALAASFAQKQRYDSIVDFRNTYTFQIISNRPDLKEEASKLIQKDNEIDYETQTRLFIMDKSYFSSGYAYGMLPFSDIKKLSQEAGLEFPYENLGADEVIRAGHMYLLSFISERLKEDVGISGKTYHQTDSVRVPYLGYMQENMDYYIVNDETYEELLTEYEADIEEGRLQAASDAGPKDLDDAQAAPAAVQKDPDNAQSASAAGQKDLDNVRQSPHPEQMYLYNYRIKDIYNYAVSKDALDAIMINDDNTYTGRVAVDPYSDDIRWIKVEYSLCVFMFLVFVLASGSILFMKLYNDSFEDRERFMALSKIGIARKTLGKAVINELRVAYALPFVFMTLSSYFAVHSLEKMMSTDLKAVNMASVLIIFIFFLVFYKLSVFFAVRNRLDAS